MEDRTHHHQASARAGEMGVTTPQASYPTCFGAPSMPRDPTAYVTLLKQRISRGGGPSWLLNMRGTGGPYGAVPECRSW